MQARVPMMVSISLLIVLAVSGCDDMVGRVRGSRNVITESRDVGGFNGEASTRRS